VSGFTDPRGVWLPPEFFNEDVVVSGKNIGWWNNVHVDEASLFVFFRDGVVFTLHVFAESLDVLDH
jgi:hypothetical protein